MFGLGPRYQDIRRNFEIQPPKFLVAGEVLRGNSTRAPGNERKIPFVLRITEFLFWMRVEPRAVAPELVHQQQLRGQRRRRHTLAFEMRDRAAQDGTDINDWLAPNGSAG